MSKGYIYDTWDYYSEVPLLIRRRGLMENIIYTTLHLEPEWHIFHILNVERTSMT